MTNIVLASASPRRFELLAQLGVSFNVSPADIDETPFSHESPQSYVERMAKEKAAVVFKQQAADAWVIGSDTSVVCNGVIFGKPNGMTDAKRMLSQLSGCTHQVLSGVALHGQSGSYYLCSTSDVTFAELSELEIEKYWHTGEPIGKAGGYAIQGLAAKFITHLQGSYSGVMGLPLFETATLLTQQGIELD